MLTCSEYLRCLTTFVLLLVTGGGCGGGADEVELYWVTGTVTFQNQPVEAGEITFEDPSTGAAKLASLEAGGTYEIELPAGQYQIGITPLAVAGASDGTTPADDEYAKVDNIPAKYYWGGESGLNANVSQDAVTHDFNMTP